jgi:hypothetical protein
LELGPTSRQYCEWCHSSVRITHNLKALSVAHRKVKSNSTSECTRSLLTDSCAAVRHVFQALSIHESRAMFHEQVAQQDLCDLNEVLKQMSFLGNHSDMAQNAGRSGFADPPAAWIIGQLQYHLHLRFDEGKLHERFCSYPKPMNLAGTIRGAASTSGTANNCSTTTADVQTDGATVNVYRPHWIE